MWAVEKSESYSPPILLISHYILSYNLFIIFLVVFLLQIGKNVGWESAMPMVLTVCPCSLRS